MTQGRVKITIMVESRDPTGKLTKADQWDIITAAAITVRASIEQYVAPSQRQKACDAVAAVVRGPLPDVVKYRDIMVPSPFEGEEAS